MNKLIVILFLGIHYCCFSQNRISIEVSPFQDTIKPGAYLTLFFTVKKEKSNNHTFRDTLVLPQNWYILTRKVAVLNDTTTRLMYTLATSQGNRAGHYSIRLELEGNEGKVDKTIQINIEKIRKIDITALNQPEYAREGDTVRVEYLIQNFGNTTEKLMLATSRGTIEAQTNEVTIEPYNSQKVIVKQSLPTTENSFWQASSDIKVLTLDGELPIFQAVSFPVYSSSSKQKDTYHRFPIEIGSAHYYYKIGEKDGSTLQFAANGRGYLDATKKHHIDFLLRGPDRFTFPVFGNYDEYGLTYTYKDKTHITVGDYTMQFNNLMEFGRFGRGAKFEHFRDNSNVTLFYQKSRFNFNQNDAFGGSVGFRVGGDYWINFNAISKNVIYHNNKFVSNIVGGSSQLKTDNFSMATEFAFGHALQKVDLGFYNKLTYSWKKFHFSNDVIYAGKEFYGFHNNSQLLFNSISYTLNRKVNFGISNNISRINPSLDATAFYFSPYSQIHSLYVNYQYNTKSTFSLHITKQEREDRQMPSKFHYKEDFANLSYNLNHPKWTIFTQSRIGMAQNLLAQDSTKRLLNYSNIIQPVYKVLPWLWVGTYFEHQYTGKFTVSNTLQGLYFYGGSLQVSYNNMLNINIMYRNNYAPDELFEKRSFLDATLNFETKYQTLSLSAGKAYFPILGQDNRNTTFISLRNMWKINVPLKKNRDLRQVKGQITGLSQGVIKQGIIVHLDGFRSITDSTGAFQFNNLLPQKYHITLGKSKNTEGVMPTEKMPMEVDVKKDKSVFVKIPLINTGNIIGKIFHRRPDSFDPILYADRQKFNVQVKITNGTETFITEVNHKNEFAFKEMKPGIWKINVYTTSKQNQITFLDSEQTVELLPQGINFISFHFSYTEKKIQMTKQGYQLKIKD